MEVEVNAEFFFGILDRIFLSIEVGNSCLIHQISGTLPFPPKLHNPPYKTVQVMVQSLQTRVG